MDKVLLLDSSYFSDSLESGRKFKKFFEDLCKNIFQANREIYERSGNYPLLYGEKNSYSAMSVALHQMGLGHISEFGLDCKGKGIKKNQCDDEAQYRSIDFWFGTANENSWVEVKNLNFNAGKQAHYEFTQSERKKIENAITQIDDLKKLKESGNKIALFNIAVYYYEGQEPSPQDLEKVPNLINDELSGYLDGRRYMGLLCSVLDLRDKVRENDFYWCKEYQEQMVYVPYIIIAGIVLQ